MVASLAALLAFAVDHHYLEVNPARVQLALRRGPPRRHVTLAPADLIAVWRRQRNHSRLADVTLFLGLTGLRWGELIALRPCDIVQAVRAGPVLTITRSIVRAGGEGTPLVKATKANCDRLVPLSRVALQIADQWADGTDREDLLVTGSDGGPLKPSYFRGQVHWTQTVPAGLRIQDMRHSAATNLLQSGADILGVQGILGHSTRTTTLRFYGHVTGAEHLRAAMDHYEEPLAAGLHPSGGASGATWPPGEAVAFIGEMGNPQQ
ncbi:MAG: tyrosine-type recombinase/integrase [Actinomycetota bacterium]|nr:tyrosine-type recombinase/integrase [Actinomycetota bacterium]